MLKKSIFMMSTVLCCLPTALIDARTSQKNGYAYALHTVINLFNCSANTYTNLHALTSFTAQICNHLGIRPLAEPAIVYHLGGYGYASGYAVTQQASNHTTISIHVDELRGDVYVDIFSAMRYNDDALRRFVIAYFQASSSESDAILRN
jgi:hypothetical protein